MSETVSRSPLLPTPARKTTQPDNKGLVVRRQRLIDRLQLSQSDQTLVQAAAGSGKTVFAAQWAETLGNPVAWVTLDATDNDPVVLISTVVNSLFRAGMGREWEGEPLTGDEPTYSRRVLPHYRITLESEATAVTLVLDDIHEVTQPEATSLLRLTAEALPAGSHAIMIGRSLDTLPLASWLSEDHTTAVTDTDLAMDAAEITELLAGLGEGIPGRSVVDELLAATGGWCIAVYLCARFGEVSRPADQAHFGSFLDKEVLRGADAGTVRFLTATAPLIDLSGELCDHVLQAERSGEILARTEAASLLVTSSREKAWYRLHPLLREHLRERLRVEDPELFRTVTRRASEWSSAAGFVDLAIGYARESGDLELLGNMVWEGAAEALLAGQSQRVLAWLRSIDERDVARSCPLALSATWAAMNRGNSTDAYRWSQAVFANVYEGWESNLGRSSVEAGLACLLGASGALGYERSAEFASEALGSLPADHVIRPFAQMLAGWMQALAGDGEAGVDNLRRAAQLARARGLAGTEVEAESLLATVLLSRGDIRGAEPLVRESLDAWERRGISYSLATRALLIGPATLIAARAGQVEPARTRLEQADQFASAFGPMLPWLQVVIESFSAAAHMHLGDHERAGHHLSAPPSQRGPCSHPHCWASF